ncbi:LysR family transcriptional regulator ArgP [Microbacterium sediminicola]|uniref:LysR family transcriptional regulator ArgP n=1 Tax=Microbacterium sediminicola TaxID=415210 RepID=A0ABN2HWD1_9MICO
MRLPADLVETLAAAVDAGTMDAAARRLQITPSAVSQRIKSLEAQVGRVLLVRSKPVRATEAGNAVVRMARQLALIEHDALADIGVETTATVTVPLAVNADSLATWFLDPLARLAREHSVVFDIHRDDQDFTAGLLEAGTVMGAVTSRHTPVAGCRVHPLGILRYEAVATAGFIARHLPDGPTPAALATAPVIDFDRRDDLQRRWLEAAGVSPDAPPRHYVPSSADFATAVHLGLGWALLPRIQSQAWLDDGSLLLLGGPAVDVPLFWQQWDLRSPLLETIADAVLDAGRRILAVPVP